MLDLNNAQFVGHVLAHPFEGFEDLRWKRKGSLPAAIGIVIALFITTVVSARFYGFQFQITYIKLFNIVPYFVRSIAIFLVWVVANWAMCTLFDGEGTMKKIFIYSAYAIIPYTASGIINIILSHVMVPDESIFLTTINVVGIIWSVVLLLTSQRAVHQFTVGKTIAMILLTIVAMIAILFLLVLLLTLFQQVIIFILSIYTEISYRFKV
jgi:hypothetical protein